MNKALQILVVDDSPQDRALVIRELRSEYPDAELCEAMDQRHLDACLRDSEPDLVVTDYHLHWSDGIVVLNRVKARWPNCPVIMFTATGNEEVAVNGMRQGLDDYIVKSVKHLLRLRTATRSALEHAATRKRADELDARLTSLLSHLRVGVFSCDANGKFLDRNSAMQEFCNCLAAGPSPNLRTLFGNDPCPSRLLDRIAEGETPQECEIDVTCQDGTNRCFRLSVSTDHRTADSFRIDGLLEDVTQRKQSEAEMRESQIAAARIQMLSPRETQVKQEVVQGNANKIIARNLDISEKTVEKHRSSLMKKLRVRSVAELVRMALLAEAIAK